MLFTTVGTSRLQALNSVYTKQWHKLPVGNIEEIPVLSPWVIGMYWYRKGMYHHWFATFQTSVITLFYLHLINVLRSSPTVYMIDTISVSLLCHALTIFPLQDGSASAWEEFTRQAVVNMFNKQRNHFQHFIVLAFVVKSSLRLHTVLVILFVIIDYTFINALLYGAVSGYSW